jgi:hypothetical protein
MYCTGAPQKTAPPLVQSALHLPGATFATQLVWQSMFVCTRHEPLQLAWHLEVQSVPTAAEHDTAQRLLQSSMHAVEQLAPLPLHAVAQLL